MENKLRELFEKLLENRLRRALALILAIVVTFTTTYTLVLPAITLEKDVAETMPGVSMGGNEQERDSSSSSEDNDSGEGNQDDSNADTVSFDAEAKNDDGETETVVHVEADADAFPEGTTMEATIVTDQEVIDTIAEAAEGEVVAVHAVDLTFSDENGETVQPAEGSQVSVTLSAGEGETSDTQNEEESSDLAGQKEESDGEEAASDTQNTETTVVQYTEETGAEQIETNDDVSFQVQPETDLDQDNAVSFDMSEQTGDQNTQTYALVETVTEDNGKENGFTEQAEDADSAMAEEGETLPEEDSDPSGVVNMAEEGPAAEAEEEEILPETPSEVPAEPEESILTTGNKTYTVTVTFTSEACIPEDAYLQVEEILEDETYDTHLEETQKALNEAAQTEETEPDGIYAGPEKEEEPQFFGARSLMEDPEAFDRQQAAAEAASDVPEPEIVYARFFDITILDADGNEVKPDVPVKVTIELMNNAQDEEVIQNADAAQVVHLGEDKAEVMESEMIEDAAAAVTFDVDSSSVYGVVYTVDFHLNGYDYSIPGGGAITLAELFAALEIDKDPALVTDVIFSNPSLVAVARAGEEDATVADLKASLGLESAYSAELTEEELAAIDGKVVPAGAWVLLSLQAFDTEETLTVTMEDGEVFTVKVTDAHEITGSEATDIDINKAYIICYDDGTYYHILHNDGTQDSISKEAFPYLAEYYASNTTWAFQYVFKEYDREGTEGYNYYLIRSNDDISSTLAIYEEVSQGEDLIQSSNNNIAVLPVEGGGFYLSGYNGYRLAFENGKFVSKQYNEGDPDTGSVMHIFERDTLPQYILNVSTNYSDRGVVWCYNPSFVLDEDTIALNYTYNFDGGSTREVYNRFDLMSDNGVIRHIDQDLCAFPWGEQGKNNTYRYKFDHWELNGERLDPEEYPWKIPAGKLEVPYNGSNLVAHFVYDDTFEALDEQMTASEVADMSNWLNEFQANRVPLDETKTHKTAEVYDYENRIYRVDLTTKSNLRTFNGNIDLGFSLDVSNSMLFPSDLQPYTNLSSVNLRYANSMNLGLDTSKTYYIISDRKNRSTVFKIFYRDGKWRYTDASKNEANEIKTSTTFHAVSDDNNDNNYTYQLYYANPDSTGVVRDRFYYLNQSINSITDDLVKIKDTLNVAGASSPKVKVGYNTFNGYVQNGEDGQKSDRRPLSDVTAINPTFENVKGGGTRPDRAIQDAKTLGWSGDTRYLILITDGAPQGGGGGTTPEQTAAIRAEVRRKAEEIKATTGQNVKIITIGLSMKDVEEGRKLLYDIADYAPNNGPKMFYLAEKTQDLTNILRQILDLILVDATVEGDITDTVNEAFYLVDKATGLPLQANETIDIDGNKTTDPTKVAGTVQADGKTVKWDDQTIDHKNGWHGVVYVKAKEDLIGANAVKTNDPNSPVKFLAEKYYTSNNTTRKVFDTDAEYLKTRVVYQNSPRVNVNELTFPNNSTEWTVYLGTEVDPKDQLQKLYENIIVQQVINTDSSLHYPLSENNIGDDRESAASGTSQTFLLAPVILEIIKNDSTLSAKYIHNNGLNWDAFLRDIMSENGVTVPYHPYRIEGADSNIVISLDKKILSGEEDDLVAKSPHATTVVNGTGTDEDGNTIDVPVEKYVLTVKYSPDYDNVLPKGQGGTSTEEYHTGTYGTGYQGHAAGTETSENSHVINVFENRIKVVKVDESGAEITSDYAAFDLYREKGTDEIPAGRVYRADETQMFGYNFGHAESVEEGKPGNNELRTKTEAAGEDYQRDISDYIDYIPSGEGSYPYHLKETKSPGGYSMLSAPINFAVRILDEYDYYCYVPAPDPDDPPVRKEVAQIKTKDGNNAEVTTYYYAKYYQTGEMLTNAEAYTGEQEINPSLISKVQRVVFDFDSETSSSVVSVDYSDTITHVVPIKILNSIAFSLPSTGGPGTGLFAVLGMILTAGAGILLWRRWRAV